MNRLVITLKRKDYKISRVYPIDSSQLPSYNDQNKIKHIN